MSPTKNTLMKTRKLGRNGPQVSCIGLGCMGMSGGYGSISEIDCHKVLNRALDLGCNFWDTSNAYGFGQNEKLISKVLKERRDEVFLCTKFGLHMDSETNQIIARGERDYVLKNCQESLDRLGIETIDLYYQHRVDPKIPIEETVGAMAELVQQGKVRYLGLSECSAKTLRRAYKVHPITAVQVEYSPWETFIESNGLLDACRELGVTIVAYSPLGKGFLTGKLDIKSVEKDDWRFASQPQFSKDNFDHNYQLAQKFEQLAKVKQVKAAQLCLSWVLAQGDDFIPIPGSDKLEYLEENLGSVNVVVTKEEDNQIRSLVNEVGVKGERWDPALMTLLEN